jgi:2-polyprenyl-3-methyl-5-hydroxy-6-metoxy-1,4-benzoquinol methylase
MIKVDAGMGKASDTGASGYYCHERNEILPLLPERAARILDLGAGAGATSRWLREIYPDAYIVAVENNADAAAALSACADQTQIGDIEALDSYLGSYDLVLCLDVLEHLVSPEHALKRIVDGLPMGATVIISLPNVAHFAVAAKLFLLGRFTYFDYGIMDRTHLHFYTERTALELATTAGLAPVAGIVTLMASPWYWRIVNVFAAFLLRRRLAFQFVFASVKSDASKRARIPWKIIYR